MSTSRIQLSHLTGSHDLTLTAWGPYSKVYTGISHIADQHRGMRFDLSIFPGFYRRQVMVPNAKWESGYHPWEAAADLTYYAYRFELEWKDQVYADISFSYAGENSRLVRCELVNRTQSQQNLVLHYIAALYFPPVRTYSDEPVRMVQPRVPPGGVWVAALDYEELAFANPRHDDTLVYDALWRGEERGHGFSGGSGVGKGFGRDAGDRLVYRFHLPAPLEQAGLALRFRLPQGGTGRVQLRGLAKGEYPLIGNMGEFNVQVIPLGSLSAGGHHLELVSQGGAAFDLDGFAVLPMEQAANLAFQPVEWHPQPLLEQGPQPNSLLLKYPDLEQWYGIAWQGAHSEVRQILSHELDRTLRYYIQEHVQKVLVGDRNPLYTGGTGHFTDVFVRPLPLAPRSSRLEYAMICNGPRHDVEASLSSFSPGIEHCEPLYLAARKRRFRFQTDPSGQAYRFSQDRMAATTLTNVVFPIYMRRRYIRHFTPGKWWDCLYTWDSGFIGLGLLELDLQRAIDCLNAYTTPQGDPQAAFIHHGSMVPVQMYLFLELWNRTQSRELLEYFYPRMRQYYRFIAGRSGSSTTRVLKSGLLKTWDYFYNSGGWDDYPPQVYVHKQGLEATTTPVVTTAHVLRSARILQMAAHALGAEEDIQEYQQDIDLWTDALQRYAWDEQAGFFSYVVHDTQGNPQGFLRHASGANFNRGLDGASPLVAGICTAEQQHRLVEAFNSTQQMWTSIGLSTVDQSAPYYKPDGYWNGAVWMPHQWFMWKALLNLGESNTAHRIASTALEVWKSEVEDSYNCFEHFIVQSGRGAGWHHFGGLSTPVMSWFNAYHAVGRLTTGLDVWIVRQKFSAYHSRLEAQLEIHHPSAGITSLLAGMHPGYRYRASWNGKALSTLEPRMGLVEVHLPVTEERTGSLLIEAIDTIS